MTVSTTINRVQTVGDGVTVGFPTTGFTFFDASELEVYIVDTTVTPNTETLKTITTHYTVAGGNGATGTVTMLTAPTLTDEELLIIRKLPLTQTVDLVNNDINDAEVVEDVFDRGTMTLQQLSEQLDRSIKVQLSSAVTGLTVPEPVALEFMRWNAAADSLENVELSNFTAAITTAFSRTLLDDADAAAFLATLFAAEDLAVAQGGTGASSAEAARTNLVAQDDLAWYVVTSSTYGAKGDGATDDAAAIQSAIDAAEAAGGGVVYFPAGTYLIKSTLTINNSGVKLRGAGGASLGSETQRDVIAVAATVIEWDAATAGAICIQFTTPTGATLTGKKGGGVEDLVVDGSGVATIGIEYVTWDGSYNANVTVVDCVDYGWSLGVMTTALGDNISSQHNTFINIGYQNIIAADTSVGLILWGDGANGNASYNSFANLWLSVRDGDAMSLENSDSNTFTHVRAASFAGTGGSIALHSDDSGLSGKGAGFTTCRGNTFFYLGFNTGGETIVAKKTVATTVHSTGNAVFFYSHENTATGPTIETGADLFVFRSSEDLSTDGASMMGRGRRGCHLTLTADEVIGTAAYTNIDWDAQSYDTDAMWSTSSGIVIPDGVKMIRLTGQIKWTAHATGYRELRITKGAAPFAGNPWSSQISVGAAGMYQQINGTLEVAPGDTLRLQVYQNSGGDLNVKTGNDTWITVELL